MYCCTNSSSRPISCSMSINNSRIHPCFGGAGLGLTIIIIIICCSSSSSISRSSGSSSNLVYPLHKAGSCRFHVYVCTEHAHDCGWLHFPECSAAHDVPNSWQTVKPLPEPSVDSPLVGGLNGLETQTQRHRTGAPLAPGAAAEHLLLVFTRGRRKQRAVSLLTRWVPSSATDRALGDGWCQRTSTIGRRRRVALTAAYVAPEPRGLTPSSFQPRPRCWGMDSVSVKGGRMVRSDDHPQPERDGGRGGGGGGGGGGAAMAALHQCELIQNMIDISISSLQGLRTKCAASNDLTQQEIRTLEVMGSFLSSPFADMSHRCVRGGRVKLRSHERLDHRRNIGGACFLAAGWGGWGWGGWGCLWSSTAASLFLHDNPHRYQWST